MEAREISDRVKVTGIRNPLLQSQQKSTRSTPSALVARETGSHNVSCAYCKENHYSASCGKVTPTSERRDILRKEGRCFHCFVCLMKGHRASECQGTKRCRKCGRRHHQSLCELQPVPRTKSQEAKEAEDVPTTLNNVAKSKNNVLLQTVRTSIYRIVRNIGGVKLWRINKILYWRKNFGESPTWKIKQKFKPLASRPLDASGGSTVKL